MIRGVKKARLNAEDIPFVGPYFIQSNYGMMPVVFNAI